MPVQRYVSPRLAFIDGAAPLFEGGFVQDPQQENASRRRIGERIGRTLEWLTRPVSRKVGRVAVLGLLGVQAYNGVTHQNADTWASLAPPITLNAPSPLGGAIRQPDGTFGRSFDCSNKAPSCAGDKAQEPDAPMTAAGLPRRTPSRTSPPSLPKRKAETLPAPADSSTTDKLAPSPSTDAIAPSLPTEPIPTTRPARPDLTPTTPTTLLPELPTMPQLPVPADILPPVTP